jgi:hypothetical protein
VFTWADDDDEGEATAMTASVTFDTTVTATGNNTGIVVDKLVTGSGSGRRVV